MEEADPGGFVGVVEVDAEFVKKVDGKQGLLGGCRDIGLALRRSLAGFRGFGRAGDSGGDVEEVPGDGAFGILFNGFLLEEAEAAGLLGADAAEKEEDGEDDEGEFVPGMRVEFVFGLVDF